MKFGKIFLAAFLAVLCASVASIFIIFSVGAGALASFGLKSIITEPNSVLYINFEEDIVDSPVSSPVSSVDIMNMNYVQPITLRQTLTAIENAAKDPAIKGICIRPDGMGSTSLSNMEELRVALEKFKESGKFIVAYCDSYTQFSYYIATVADEILLQPEGNLDWKGVSLSTMFYKGLIDKLGADVEIFRPTVCRYKSAVEPFFLKKMSPENRKQMEVIVNSVWQTVCEDVAKSRNLNIEDLKNYAANLDIACGEDAVRYGLIDRLAYEDELYALFDSYGVERNKCGHHNSVTLSEYINANIFSVATVTTNSNFGLELVDNKSLVAVIYAEGEIVDGDEYVAGQINGTSLAREIRQARLDERTKAVVVRVNSPGGSALASDIIWREMHLLQQTKPVVISMGGSAASGGYYISAPADLIIADKTTLTGSIGVFGMMLNLGNTLSEKLGVTMDNASTSENAVTPSLFGSFTKAQREVMMKGVDQVYTTFTSKVAEGRNLSIEHVYDIAEGRVWTGRDAVEIGLVDRNGGFTDAIAAAANLADLGNDFVIYEFVSPLTPFEEWVNSLGMFVSNSLGLDYSIYGEDIENIVYSSHELINMQGVQARCVGDLKIEM